MDLDTQTTLSKANLSKTTLPSQGQESGSGSTASAEIDAQDTYPPSDVSGVDVVRCSDGSIRHKASPSCGVEYQLANATGRD